MHLQGHDNKIGGEMFVQLRIVIYSAFLTHLRILLGMKKSTISHVSSQSLAERLIELDPIIVDPKFWFLDTLICWRGRLDSFLFHSRMEYSLLLKIQSDQLIEHLD